MMKNYKYLLLVSTCWLFNNNSQATELDLTFNSTHSPFGIYTPYTHTPVELKPIFHLTGVKLASVSSIVDGHQNIGFASNNNNIGVNPIKQCEEDEFFQSCGYGYVLDKTQQCTYDDASYKCRVCSHSCQSDYSLSYCNSDQVETGTLKNDCEETCYQCRTKSCEEGGFYSSVSSCDNYTTVTFAGKTCYTNITNKSCSDAGYVSSIPTNQVGQVTNFCGNTCYYDLRTPPCSEGGYEAAIPNNQTCSSTTYYGQTCYYGCLTPACVLGGYSSNIPSNQVCSSTSYYGQTCYYGCYQPDCSDGGYASSIPSNNVCSSTSYYGRTCYQNCYQPTCSEGGYLASIPSEKNCSSTSYYGRTCYKDCVNACTPKGCSGYTLSSCPSNAYCSSCTVGCGDNTTKYKVSGCQAGYGYQSGKCVLDVCPNGYSRGDGCNCGSRGAKLAKSPGGSQCYQCCSSGICFTCARP